jgi:hypothetical protein
MQEVPGLQGDGNELPLIVQLKIVQSQPLLRKLLHWAVDTPPQAPFQVQPATPHNSSLVMAMQALALFIAPEHDPTANAALERSASKSAASMKIFILILSFQVRTRNFRFSIACFSSHIILLNPGISMSPPSAGERTRMNAITITMQKSGSTSAGTISTPTFLTSTSPCAPGSFFMKSCGPTFSGPASASSVHTSEQSVLVGGE